MASFLVGLLVVGHLLGLYTAVPLLQLDNALYDARLRFLAPGGVDERVVILDIDEASLAHPELGRWPWSRDVMARLVDTLFETYQVRALGFDVIFAEEDRSSGLAVLNRLAQTELQKNQAFLGALDELRPQLDYDARFARAIEGRPIVMGYYFSASQNELRLGELPFPTLERSDLNGRDAGFARWSGYGANLPSIAASGLMAGHVSPAVDADGVIRKVPLLAVYDDGLYESLALAMVRLEAALAKTPQGDASLRFDPVTLWPAEGALQSIRLGEKDLLIDEASNMLVPYRGGPGSFRYISMAEIWEGRVQASLLKDKLVLVGTTAPGLLDLRSTPVSGIYPGVEVHANLIAAMLSGEPGRLKHTPAATPFIELAAALFLWVSLPVILILLSVLTATVVVAVLLSSLVVLNAWAWLQGLAFPLASLLSLVLLIYMTSMVFGLFVEARSRRQFKDLFGQYVPPELVEKMAEDPEKYSMEGRRENLTVLFSDVVGFNPISQALKPKELAEFINHYLTEMSSVIRDSGGTLDKYIGDCIMAFWGAPVSDPHHASNGVKAALGMKHKLYEIRDYCDKRGWPTLAIGIGLSTGEMVVGDMGSKVRKSYTVMGEAVNTGSRLENLTRVYGSWILVSQTTQQACDGSGIVFREVDFVRVKGRSEPIRAYEPMGLEAELSQERLDEIERWHQALIAYRAQDWEAALSLLAALHGQRPIDKLYELFIDRATQYKQSPPDASWDGVTTFETKKG